VKEILPGIYHWTAMHPKIGFEVSSYFVAESGTVLDPMVPPQESLAWFADDREAHWLALTNRHHDRQAADYCAAFALGPVLVPESGLHEFDDKDLDVRGYAAGEEIIPGIVAHEVGAICPDDMALEIRSAGALAMADGLVHFRDGVRFVRDSYMDEPAQTKRALARSLERLLDVDFDTLLFAHGEPIVGEGKQTLRNFLATNPAG
jgi:glyoxylase-like metal-dependent hydrolase (beta-lactamase superfamily II)